MKMSKVVRKQNDKLLGVIQLLTDLSKQELTGFSELTYTIQFDLFPGSLLVNIHFESRDQLDKNLSSEKLFQKKLQKLLLKQGIVLKDAKQNLKFVTAS